MIITTTTIEGLNATTFKGKVIQSRKLSLVLFKAKWSGNAHLQETVISNLRIDFAPTVNFYSIDVERAKRLAAKFNVEIVPTLLLFRQKKVEAYLPGLHSFHDLADVLQQLSNQRKKYQLVD